MPHTNDRGGKFDESDNHWEIQKALDNIPEDGSWAGFRPWDEALDMGLSVFGIGDIELPLRDDQARQLIAKSRQASISTERQPFPAETESAYPGVWELDAGQLVFLNPKWPDQLCRLCASVTEALGFGLEMTPEVTIDKMLIFEKGATLWRNANSGNLPGAFGTLLVHLPSSYEGGNILVKHGDETKEFEPSLHTQSIACWYSDVEYEIQEVTSGYSCALVYSIVCRRFQAPRSAALQDAAPQNVRPPLELWLSQPSYTCDTKAFAYILYSDYDQGNISIESLLPRDQACVEALEAIAKDLPVEAFLAEIEIEKHGICEWDAEEFENGLFSEGKVTTIVDPEKIHFMDHEKESYSRLRQVLTLDGKLLGENISFERGHIMDDTCHYDTRPDEESVLGVVGDKDLSIIQWTRYVAVLIVPHRNLSIFLAKQNTQGFRSRPLRNPLLPIEYLGELVLGPSGSNVDWEVMRMLCEAEGFHDYVTVTAEGWSQMMKVGLDFDEFRFFEAAARRTQGRLPLEFYPWLRQWLRLDQEGGADRFDNVKAGLEEIIQSQASRSPGFSDAFKIISAMAPLIIPIPAMGFAAKSHNAIHEWAKSTICGFLKWPSASFSERDDGQALVEAVRYFKDRRAYFKESVIGKIDQNKAPLNFIIGVVTGLHQLNTSLSDEICRDALEVFLRRTDFASLRARSKELTRAKHEHETSHWVACQRTRTFSVHPSDLGDMFSTALRLGGKNRVTRQDYATSIALALVDALPKLAINSFENLWVPFLQIVMQILVESGTSLEAPVYQKMFSSFLSTFVNNYLGHETAKNESLVREAFKCGCAACLAFNEFLIDPERSRCGFVLQLQQHTHIEKQLKAADLDCKYNVFKLTSKGVSFVIWKVDDKNTKTRESWYERRVKAVKLIRGFKQDHLKTLLGPDFLPVVTMEHLLLAKNPESRDSLAGGIPGHGGECVSGPSEGGIKRKRDVDVVMGTGDTPYVKKVM